jgi:hypothetical protein
MIDYSNKKITIFIHISLFKGGIDAKLLTLAYEPEAAAIYCKEYAVQKYIKYNNIGFGSFRVMIVTDPCVQY